jgi:hypothetical protein
MRNQDVIDLYRRVSVGTPVVVLDSPTGLTGPRCYSEQRGRDHNRALGDLNFGMYSAVQCNAAK